MSSIERYKVVLQLLCNYYGYGCESLLNFSKKRENKYIILLLLKEFNCLNKKQVAKELELKSDKSISYHLKRAEEKLLINKDFRTVYFKLEEVIYENF